ncbi:MAG: hypothetical protein ACHQ1H_05755 [Nitrososphaerales archaeon]
MTLDDLSGLHIDPSSFLETTTRAFAKGRKVSALFGIVDHFERRD